MIRYFISYKNLVNNNKINKKFNIDSPELVIFKKNKNKTYRGEPILFFNDCAKDLLAYADKIEQNKKGIMLMVKLDEDELNSINPIFIKQFETDDDKTFKLKPNKIKLINYNCFINMNTKEINSGNIHDFISLSHIFNSEDSVSLNVINDGNVFDKRQNLIKKGLGSDIYFYTTDEEVLDRYRDDITVLEETELDMFKITNHKLFVIDSIPQERVYDLSNDSFRFLYKICNNSLPIYIDEVDYDRYEIYVNKNNKKTKKAYLITDYNIKNLICDSSIIPFLKYIYVYELKNGNYVKTNIEDYMKEKDILKYIKKPS